MQNIIRNAKQKKEVKKRSKKFFYSAKDFYICEAIHFYNQ